MFISLMNGGLGNQTFQYIFARYIEIATGRKVLIDDCYFYLTAEEEAMNRAGLVAPIDKKTHNGYEIPYVFPYAPKQTRLSEYFEPDVWGYMIKRMKDDKICIAQQLKDNGLDFTMITECDGNEIEGFTGKRLWVRANCFIPEFAGLKGNIYFYGYWINPIWFRAYKDVMLKELAFRPISDPINKQYEDGIKSGFSVSVHIRRGDFVKLEWNLSEEYYREVVAAIAKKIPEATFFVFSDEIGWCKENAKSLGLDRGRAVFVEGNYDHKNNYIDMQLMSMCDMQIVGVSSFAYLASLLNQKPGFHAVQLKFKDSLVMPYGCPF